MDIIKAIDNSENETLQDLKRIIGLEHTAELVKKCGGGTIYIPLYDTIIRESRDEEIYNDFLAGVPRKDIARKYKLSDISVYRIVQRMAK